MRIKLNIIILHRICFFLVKLGLLFILSNGSRRSRHIWNDRFVCDQNIRLKMTPLISLHEISSFRTLLKFNYRCVAVIYPNYLLITLVVIIVFNKYLLAFNQLVKETLTLTILQLQRVQSQKLSHYTH